MALKRYRLDLALMLLAFAFALTVRIYVTVGFDGLYGQDAYAYYIYAQTLRASISQHSTLPPFFWPLGYPMLLAIGFTIFGTTPLTAQAISLLLGAALAPLVYVLARQIGATHWGALAAGLIMGLCGQAIQSSFVTMSDIPSLFWATLSGVILIHYLRDQRIRWIVLAALTLAIACITRWLYLALIPVWAAALLITWRRIRWRETFAAAIAAGLILIPQAAVSVHSPYPVLDHAWVEGWSPLNAFAHEFSNVDGHFVYPQINAQYYAMPYYDAYFLAPLFTPFLLIGLWALRRKRVLLLIVLAWALLPYLFLAGIPYQNIRFPLIIFPAVAALVGLGLDTALRWSASLARDHSRAPLQIIRYLIFVVVVVIGLAQMGNIGRQNVRTFINNQQADKTAVAWAIQHIPTGTRLYTFGVTEPLQIYSSLEVHELYDETEASISDQLKNGKESYVFVNAWQIENQFAGHDLQKTFNWMYQYLGLQQLGQIGNYTLYKVIDEDLNSAAGLQQPSG